VVDGAERRFRCPGSRSRIGPRTSALDTRH
jgi:hypothetical protein